MHACPECGQACDCDDDDVWNDCAALDCTHDCDDEEDDDQDGMFYNGCIYGDRCLMPGFHSADECHTIEDIQAYEHETARDDHHSHGTAHGFYTTTPNGVTAHVTGDPNMSDTTLAMLHELMDAAYKQFTRED